MPQFAFLSSIPATAAANRGDACDLNLGGSHCGHAHEEKKEEGVEKNAVKHKLCSKLHNSMQYTSCVVLIS